VTAKSYVVARYTAPAHTPEAYEAWNEAAWKWNAEAFWPACKKAGAVSWRVTGDEFGNTPRIMNMIEFPTVEQAMAWFISPAAKSLMEQFIALGTLDVKVTVHSLRGEGS
jgi:antibiotic biosynthesis monooxygenase (ABM) superfamily enzyme